MDLFSALKILFYVGSGVASYKSYKKAKKLEKQANQLLIQKYGTGGGIPVSYGTRRVAGTVLYANTINNRELFVVYAISVGEIHSISNIKIGGRSVADTSVFDHFIQRNSNYFGSTQAEIDRILANQDPPNKPRMVFNCHMGEADQVADPMLVGCVPEWTSAHRLKGIAYIACNFDYDSGGGMFTGLPEITCDVQGKKIYDPRLDSTVTNGSGSQRINDPSTFAFTNNTPLVLLDYLTNSEYGKSLPTSAIDMQSFITAANKNTTQQTFTYSATLQSLSSDGEMRFKKTAANLAVYNKLKVGNPITIKIGSTTYASGTVVGKTSNSRADRLEDAYDENHSEYQEPRETLYVIQLSSGAVTTAIAFNPTAVSIDITSTQDRFPFNGVIDTEETVFDNTKKILANMRGIFNYINGIYSLKIEDSEAVALSINDDDILESGIKVSIENKEEKFNIVEVEFANAQKDYELDTATYKHVSATSGQDYKYDDGGEELKLTIEMPFITNYNIVYQNAKAVLLRSRNNKTISFTGTHKLLYVKVGELISVTNSRVAMSAEQYRITKMTINNDLTVSVNAVIYQSNIYGYVTPPDENIEIPGDMVDSFKSDTPTNLNFVDKDPTTGVQPYLTWTNPTTYPAYEFRVIVKDSNDNVKYDGRTKNNFFNLTGLEVDNGYTAEVRSLNTNYVESQAATYNFNNSVPPVQNDDLGSGSVTDSKVADISADKIDTGVLNLGSESGMAVRQTKTGYTSTATGFWLGNDGGTPKFNIGTSTNYLQFDGSNLQISGNISATTGTIGGFTVGDNYLRAGTGTTRISLSTVDGIHLGNNTFASAPFRVGLNGDLTASSATIDGDITATTLTVEEANIQSLKLTLGGGILQDGSNNDLTVLNVINPDFPVDGLLHYFPLNGFSDPNDTTPTDVIDVVSDVTGVITGSNGSFATDSPNGQSYVNGDTTGITLLSDAQADTWQSTTGDYTVALWFKSTTESGGGTARIIGRDASDFWSLALAQGETGNQTVTLFTDGESLSWDGASANEWHHIALVVNGTTSAKVYVDGVLRITETDINYTSNPRPVVLGCNTESVISPSASVFLGKFSDVRFYTKAITDKQVQSLYMNPAGGLPAKIEGDLFVTNTITADKLDVNTLDSISANLGSITAGDIDIGGGDFTVSATGVMTATGATISGNVTTTTLVVTEDADVIGNLKATSLASNIVKIGNLHQEVWNEIDARTATTQNGFYDEFTSAGGVGYIGVEKNFELLGSGSSGYLVNANNITLRGGSVSIVGSSTTQFTGTALQFTAQYQYKLTSGSTWTNTGSADTATADVAESGGIYYYEVDADPDAQITGLTAGSYYQFRLKITPVVTNNVFRVSPTGAADSNGITIIFEAQQSSTSTGTGAGTVTSVTAGDGLSGGTITSSGTLTVDSTVVRTTGTQSIAGDKTFNNDIIIQGNLDVQGTTTTVNTDDLNVKDKNITLNYSTGDSSASANGAGITIQDAVSATQDATLTWNTSSDRFGFSHGLDFPDSALLAFGDGDDLRILHNGTNSVFSNYTGNLDFKNFADDTDIRFWSDDGAGNSAIYFRLDGSQATASQLITRWDDNSRIALGSTNDLQLYHDGYNSYISDEGTGELRLRGSSYVKIMDTNNEVGLQFRTNGAVTLYHNNLPKFETTSGGASITGELDTTGNIAINKDVAKLTINNNVSNGQASIDIKNTGLHARYILDGDDLFRIYNQTSGFDTFAVKSDGDLYMGSTKWFDLSRNLTNIGNISSGAITASNASIQSRSSSGTNRGVILNFNGEISQTSSDASWLHLNRSHNGNVVVGYNSTADFDVKNNIKVNSTTVIDSSRAISNITGLSFSDGNASFDSSDANGYARFTHNGGSAQIGLFRTLGSVGGMYIGGSADGFRVYTANFAQKLLIDQSGNATFAGTINSGGITSSSDVRADTHFNSTDTNATLSATGTGNVYLRPNGKSSTAGQVHIATSGNATFAGDVSLTTGDLAVEGTIELGNNYIIPNTNGTAGQVLKYPPAGGSSALVWSDIDTGAVTSISNNANNRILTATGGTTINGESGLTFDGATLGVVGDISLGDNKKIYLGTGNDTEIYFDGSNSYFLGTGNTFYTGATSIHLASGIGVGSQTYLTADYSNGVKLYHTGAIKAKSTATGFDVTGTITADGLTVDSGSSDINIVFDDDSVTNRFKFTTGGNSLDSFFDVNSGSSRASHIRTISGSVSFDIASGFSRNDINFSNADLFIKRSGTKALEVDHATGDISFYDDTGSTQGLFWDASAEQLLLGITATAAGGSLVAKTDSNGYGIAIEENSGSERWSLGVDVDGDLNFINSADTTPTVSFNDAGNATFTGTVTSDDTVISGSNPTLTIYETDTTNLNTRFDNGGGDLYIQTINDDGSNAKTRMLIDHATGDINLGYEDTGTTAKLFWDASAERLGIGETNIDAKLHLTTASAGLINQKFESATSAAWRLGIPASQTYFAFDNANDNLSSPKVVIDSSGNLLVSTTNASVDTGVASGVVLAASDQLLVGTSAAHSAAFNRIGGASGDIIQLKHNGSTVGSIGSRASAVSYMVLDPRSASNGGVGIGTTGQAIVPTDYAGANVNGTKDLGNASHKWKDLYLSGTISSGAITSTGAVLIDVDNQANGALRIVANQTNPNNDFYFAQEIISTLSGTTATTADREQGGLYLDINSTATGGDTSNEHRAYGVFVDLDSTGDADVIVGGYFNATATPSTGQTTEIIGVQAIAEDNGGAGNVTNVFGAKFQAQSDNATSDANILYGSFSRVTNTADSAAITKAIGVYGEIDIAANSGDIYGTSYVFNAEYDNNTDSAPTHTAALFFGNYSGTLPTSAYGIFIPDAVRNRFDGSITTGRNSTTTAAYGFNGDLNTGMYSPADHQIGFLTSGGQRLKITSATAEFSTDIELTGNIETGTFTSLGNASVQGTFTSEGLFTTDSKAQIEGIKGSATDAIATIKNKHTTNEGRYLQFLSSIGTNIGQIGHLDQTESNFFISTFGTGLKFESYITYKAVLPCNENGADSDNAIDLGSSSVRFDDVYATNGTIQTSDRNEKQDIQALTDAEQRVATACKGLIRRFRWQDSVAEKDNNPDSDETARYHFGVIAQDLQDAFTAEGLDASDYGMFISSTWEDGDGVEQTRLGVRYNELLSFIITTI